MSVQERKRREREQRHELIITTARELAETAGWDTVTVRRLAQRIEYSQPVLYSHFDGKDDIVAAVAMRGFAELRAAIHNDVRGDTDARAVLSALAETYITFAQRHPATYDAMFSLHTGLPFDDPATPAPLREAFDALVGKLADAAGAVPTELFAEIVWAALHGLVTLTRAGRLPPERTAQRLEVLLGRLADGPTGGREQASSPQSEDRAHSG